MPRTSAQGLLSANRDTILVAAVHAAAHLVLSISGEERLTREERQRYVKVLRELLAIAREDSDVPQAP